MFNCISTKVNQLDLLVADVIVTALKVIVARKRLTATRIDFGPAILVTDLR